MLSKFVMYFVMQFCINIMFNRIKLNFATPPKSKLESLLTKYGYHKTGKHTIFNSSLNDIEYFDAKKTQYPNSRASAQLSTLLNLFLIQGVIERDN
jgi:hypothetical protein